MLSLRPGMRVLDVCGGTADLALLAAARVGPTGQVAVYDINPAMLAHGRRKVRQRGEERSIDFVLGDAERIAFPDRTFDAVMVGFGIRNLTHLKSGLREMRRVLKPCGSLLCLEFSRPRSPLFRQLYDWYSFTVMPMLGELFTGSAESYACLPETIRMFPLADELAQILTGIGLEQVRYRLLTDGIAAVHVGRAPALTPAPAATPPPAAAPAAAGWRG
jgi:demethylmenaquinone methyltransferase/2-methoxy-6-polyprenyl-1,4-benzoquinol methylase